MPARKNTARYIGVALFGCLLQSVSQADILLSAATATVSPDVPLTVQITVTNPTRAPQTTVLPPELMANIEVGGRVRQMVLARDAAEDAASEVTLAPGEFHQVNYIGELPRGFLGMIVLTPSNLQAGPLLLQVTRSPTTEPPPLAVSIYEPIYFIAGGDGGLNAKFQLSMRFQLFDSRSSLVRHLPLLDNLYLGYSQTSLWDLHEFSAPFRDSSYRPRLFYANYDIDGSRDGLWHFGAETGLGHESNGKAGEDSRSLNMVYARPTLMLGDPLGKRFFVAPLIATYIHTDTHDIYRYRGYVDFEMGYGSKAGWNAWTTLRHGTGHAGSIELNLSYPLSRPGRGNLSGWVLLQYFDGYGESLLDYNRKLGSQLRVGLAVAL